MYIIRVQLGDEDDERDLRDSPEKHDAVRLILVYALLQAGLNEDLDQRDKGNTPGGPCDAITLSIELQCRLLIERIVHNFLGCCKLD